MTGIIHHYCVFPRGLFLCRFACAEFPHYVFVLFLWLISAPLHAALDIEIFGGGATQIPIAIVPFAAEERLNQSITPVVVGRFAAQWTVQAG